VAPMQSRSQLMLQKLTKGKHLHGVAQSLKIMRLCILTKSDIFGLTEIMENLPKRKMTVECVS